MNRVDAATKKGRTVDNTTAAQHFDAMVPGLAELPRCTLRIDGARCATRADRWARGRGCCRAAGIDLLCENCALRLEWWFALGVRFECSGCGAVSDSLEALFPESDMV